MSESEKLDVQIAVYLVPDLAKQDFDTFVERTKEGTISTDGVVLVTKDAEGEIEVQETGDHLGKKGAKVGGGVTSLGIVLGLVVIVSAFLLTGVYVQRANSRFDDLTRDLTKEIV